MITAYAERLRAERSDREDNNSVAVQIVLYYHKSCLEMCVSVCVFQRERRHISV